MKPIKPSSTSWTPTSIPYRSKLLLWHPTHDHHYYITSRRQYIISLVFSTKAWTNIRQWFYKFVRIIQLGSWFWKGLCAWEHFNKINVVCKTLCYIHFCWFFSQIFLFKLVISLY
jgi:hypothetical protein